MPDETEIQERCDRLNAATQRALEAAVEALFGAAREDETIPDDADKIMATTAGAIALFKSILTGAARPENELPRRLILAKMEEIARAIAKLYEIEGSGHA